MRFFELVCSSSSTACLCTQDSLAEWSKALASGASPQGRGFEPHSCHFRICLIHQGVVARQEAGPLQFEQSIGTGITQDSLAEWSKALAQGASPQGRGFEPHSCHLAWLTLAFGMRSCTFVAAGASCQTYMASPGLEGTWCSGITPAQHAGGPGFNPQCVHFFLLRISANLKSRIAGPTGTPCGVRTRDLWLIRPSL